MHSTLSSHTMARHGSTQPGEGKGEGQGLRTQLQLQLQLEAGPGVRGTLADSAAPPPAPAPAPNAQPHCDNQSPAVRTNSLIPTLCTGTFFSNLNHFIHKVFPHLYLNTSKHTFRKFCTRSDAYLKVKNCQLK